MIIHNYIDKNLFAPKGNWTEYEFRKRSYKRWAANEIINRVIKMPEVNPFVILLHFRYQMDILSRIREDSDAEFIFILARDTADEIILLF